jgi:hypothetical protein
MKKTITSISVFLGTGLISVYGALDQDTVLQKIVTEIFSPLYELVAAIAFAYFLYGAAKFIYDMRRPEEKNTGKQHLLWGFIGLLIIFSVGGILSIFGSMFGNLGIS